MDIGQNSEQTKIYPFSLTPCWQDEKTKAKKEEKGELTRTITHDGVDYPLHHTQPNHESSYMMSADTTGKVLVTKKRCSLSLHIFLLQTHIKLNLFFLTSKSYFYFIYVK